VCENPVREIPATLQAVPHVQGPHHKKSVCKLLVYRAIAGAFSVSPDILAIANFLCARRWQRGRKSVRKVLPAISRIWVLRRL